MIVGIPKLGGPSPSAIESEDDSRARVYTAPHPDSKLEVVIKVLPAEHGSHEAATLRRVNMCARARSVRLVDVVKVGDDKVALVLERAPYMFPLLAARALQQFKQLCEAVEAIGTKLALCIWTSSPATSHSTRVVAWLYSTLGTHGG